MNPFTVKEIILLIIDYSDIVFSIRRISMINKFVYSIASNHKYFHDVNNIRAPNNYYSECKDLNDQTIYFIQACLYGSTVCKNLFNHNRDYIDIHAKNERAFSFCCQGGTYDSYENAVQSFKHLKIAKWLIDLGFESDQTPINRGHQLDRFFKLVKVDI